MAVPLQLMFQQPAVVVVCHQVCETRPCLHFLQVRSTPAFFMFKGGDLVCHWAGGDACEVEAQIRRRLPADADLPAQPVLAA